MVFPIFSLLSLSMTLFSWGSSILISSHRATITRFIPVGPDAVYRCSQRRGVGLRPLPTVVSCCLLVGISCFDGVREGAQMDVLPIASYPGLPLPVTEPNHSPVPGGIGAPQWGVALRTSGRGLARTIWEEGSPRLTGDPEGLSSW